MEPDGKKHEVVNEDRYKAVILGLVGFLFAVLFIFFALLVLVRFWIFVNILYNIFIVSTMIVGVLFSISSLNLLLSEDASSTPLRTLVVSGTITIFWNVIGIILPFTENHNYDNFAKIPILEYRDAFYSGESFNPNISTTPHPYLKNINAPGTSLFHYHWVIVGFLAVLLVAQLAFWFFTLKFFVKVQKLEKVWEKEYGENIKIL